MTDWLFDCHSWVKRLLPSFSCRKTCSTRWPTTAGNKEEGDPVRWVAMVISPSLHILGSLSSTYIHAIPSINISSYNDISHHAFPGVTISRVTSIIWFHDSIPSISISSCNESRISDHVSLLACHAMQSISISSYTEISHHFHYMISCHAIHQHFQL